MRKRFLTATMVVAVAMLGVLMSSATVGARPVDNPDGLRVAAAQSAAQPANNGSANNPKAPIQENNSFCGADLPALRVIGFVNYHRTDNTVTVNWHFKDAMPNFTYQIQLWRDACTFHAILGSITTNQNGVGNLTASVTVPPTSTRFFATAFKPVPGFFDDTPAVTLLP
jgi:hypothetical protein